MAFKMNRSMTKGSPAYKKAKVETKSIVAKAPAGPDAGLVSAAELLGKSKRVPKIDFTIKQPKIDWSKAEFGKRKPKETKVKKERKKFKLGEKIGDFFVSKAGQIRDAAGNILSGIEERRAQKEIERQRKAEENKVLANEKEQLRIANKEQKEIDDTLALERSNEEKLKKRLIKEQAAYERQKAREKEKQMSREPGRYYEEGSIVTDAVGSKAIRNYSPEQLERIEEEGVWSEEQERNVLPEEIVDGKFESKAQGEEGFITQIKPITEDTTPTPTEAQTTNWNLDRKPRPRDFEGGFVEKQKQYKAALDQWWENTQGQDTPLNKKLFHGAIKGGKVQQNMIRSGYKPQ